MEDGPFIRPEYDSRCFSQLPPLVEHLLTGAERPPLPSEVYAGLAERYEAVVLLLVDAFGWRFFAPRLRHHPLLRRGHHARLTAQFPSTTAAHITCIHTGLPVGQSGVVEWNYYEPELDAIIVPLLFSFAGEKERNTLSRTGVEAARILPERTIYRELAARGVRSCAFQPRAHLTSPYAQHTFRGAEVCGYTTLPEALVNLGDRLERREEPTYYFLYFDGIDSIGHQYGPGSPQLDAEIDTFLHTVESLLAQRLAGRLGDTLLLLTADHGLVESPPARTVYLNRELAGVERYLRRNRKGELLVPGGSCRDMFLYVDEGMVEEARAFLAERLAGKAQVRQVAELAEAGYFGPSPLAPEFAARAGDLVILPFKNESVWWYEKGKFEQKYPGHHGGLTPEEMEIPLLLWDFT